MHTTFNVNQFHIRHTRLKQKLKKNTQTSFVGPSKNSEENEKETKKNGNYKAFCVTCKLIETSQKHDDDDDDDDDDGDDELFLRYS